MDDRTDAALAAYEAALNEPDATRRDELLATALTDDARVVVPHLPDAPPLDRNGFAADCAVVQGWRPPGALLRRRGEVDGHHDWIRFAWEVSVTEGEPIEVKGVKVEGIDLVELAADGRFRTVVVCRGLLPPGVAG